MNRSSAIKEIKLSALDTVYTRREEEAKILLDDPISQYLQKEKETRQVEQMLETMSHIDFCLEYQPQVSPMTGRTVGCEALIRARSKDGELKYPCSFMPWLEKAGLMKEVDLWVFKNVCRDIRMLHSMGIDIPISINVTPDTLVSPTHFQQLKKLSNLMLNTFIWKLRRRLYSLMKFSCHMLLIDSTSWGPKYISMTSEPDFRL